MLFVSQDGPFGSRQPANRSGYLGELLFVPGFDDNMEIFFTKIHKELQRLEQR